MDPFTHLLATRLLIGGDRGTLLAGIAPDLAFYSTYPLWVLRQGRARAVLDGGAGPAPPLWMVQLHRAGHSVLVLLLSAVLLRLSSGHWLWRVLGAYLLHLLIDIPTHTRDPWGPRLAWPFSDIAYNGVSWAEVLTRAIQRRRRLRSQNRELEH
jgi:hypothetical protein